MDLVIAVICCNCAIAIVVLVITLWTIRCRKQVVSLANFCEGLSNDCQQLLPDAPASVANSRLEILRLRQIYQQQLLTLDRVRMLQSIVGFARFLLFKRR